jgi:hypothetical protein
MQGTRPDRPPPKVWVARNECDGVLADFARCVTAVAPVDVSDFACHVIIALLRLRLASLQPYTRGWSVHALGLSRHRCLD